MLVGVYSAGSEPALLLERRGWVWGAQMTCAGGSGRPPMPAAVLVLIIRNISNVLYKWSTNTFDICAVYSTVYNMICLT